MTLPEDQAARKPLRLGLYAPFLVLILAVAVWLVGWSWLRGEVLRAMDVGAERLGEAGCRVDWKSRRLSGFPFRLDLDIEDPRIREASGWGLAAPRLKAEAWVYAPTRWVVVAPAGATVDRPAGGGVLVSAKVLRASLWDPAARPPRVSVEGLGLTFAPMPGAGPFDMTQAAEFHLRTRAGPRDQGAFSVEIDQARMRRDSLLGDLSAGGPVTVSAETLYSRAGAMSGHGLAGAFRAWSEAGGNLDLRRLRLTTGASSVEGRSGRLTIGSDGRLRGSLQLTVSRAPALLSILSRRGTISPEATRALSAMLAVQAQKGPTDVALDFQAGQTTLGPVAIAAAPRIY